MQTRISRRLALMASAGAVVAGATSGSSGAADRQRSLRIAHLTDIHVQPERGAPEGMAKCLRHVQENFKPDLIINGGDAVMDASGCDLGRANVQAKVLRDVLKSECSTPILHCIGNHDIWGVHLRDSGARGDEPMFGKKWSLDLFGLAQRYYSVDRGGWHIVVLDSNMLQGDDSYRAELDEEQFKWLKQDLASTTAPVLIVSHIPILSVCSFFDGERIDPNTNVWNVPGSYMHADARRLKQLFYKHKNVKLCLSGHIHLIDRCDYLGVTYLCSGAVSGSWWNGPNQEADNGYAIVDLFADGTFEHQFVNYGWVSREK